MIIIYESFFTGSRAKIISVYNKSQCLNHLKMVTIAIFEKRL